MTDYREHMNENLAGSAVARIKKGGARALKAGGLWIYDNEIARVDGEFKDGDILAVEDFDGYFLGWGFINRASKICIRMLSRKKEQTVTPAFLQARVRAAWEYRRKVIDTSSCRLIFGEADFLPGLTVDKYEDVLVVESLALGIDRLKPMILSMLRQILAEDGVNVRGIYERSDAKVREKEGLPRTKGFIGEPFDTLVPITENGVRYMVDVENGQKTGFFLDQKENRRAIAKLCPGARVLDCFTHTGSFGLNAALAGVGAARNGSAQSDPTTGNTYWWLRTPGMFSYSTAYVNYTGSIRLDGVESPTGVLVGVRPCMWVNAAALGITGTSGSSAAPSGANVEQISAFVDRLYAEFLGRSADDAGRQYWVNKILNGMSAVDVSAGFVFSNELRDMHLSNEEFVRRAYTVYLNREPDAAGIAYWVAFLERGNDYGCIIHGFGESAEFTGICNSYGVTRGDYPYTYR